MKKSILILIAIIAFAFVLRAYKINQSSLYGDELTAALDAYSILKTGMDETGKTLPLTFAMRGGSPPGYIYASIPSIFLFGPTALGIRAASLLSGTLMVFLMFLIAKRLFSERTALIVAFLTAISTWGINLSRGGFETNLALALSLAGLTLFLYSQKRFYYWVLGAICFGLAVFTYPTYKLTVPLFLPVLYWYLGGKKFFFNTRSIRYSVVAAVILLSFAALLASQIFFSHSEGRFLGNNIFAKPELREAVIQKVNLERTIDSLGPAAVVFHNKPVEFFNELKDSYFNYFSTTFIFLKGDSNPRHNMTQTGVVFFAEIVFILYALYLFVTKKNDQKPWIFLLGWLGVSPLAGALLGEAHTLRASFMLPSLLLISGVGLSGLLDLKEGPKKFFVYIALLALFVQFTFALERLYFVSPSKFANFWAYPARKASEIAAENTSSYDYIFISSRINDVEYAYPLYNRISPAEIIKSNQQKAKISGKEFKNFGNVYIGDTTPAELKDINGKFFYIAAYDPINLPKQEHDIVRSLDGTPVLVTLEGKQ